MILAQQDPASLNNLNDIVLPDPTGWLPLAPGWIALLVVVLLSLVWAMFRYWQWRVQNRYRVEALATLQRLQAGRSETDLDTTITGLDQLLKRVALAAWPRSEVARLSGTDWIEFLGRHCPASRFDKQQASSLVDLAWSSRRAAALQPQQVEGLFQATESWIRYHQREPCSTGRETVA